MSERARLLWFALGLAIGLAIGALVIYAIWLIGMATRKREAWNGRRPTVA